MLAGYGSTEAAYPGRLASKRTLDHPPDLLAVVVGTAARVNARTSHVNLSSSMVCDILAASSIPRNARGMRPKGPRRAFHAAWVHKQSPTRKGKVPTTPTSTSRARKRL